jgi:hypothetical protein
MTVDRAVVIHALSMFGRAGTMALLLLAAACDNESGPTSPTTATTLPLEPGSYVVVASAHSLLPSGAGCSGTGAFVGMSIVSFVTLNHEGTDWVARSTTPADGDAEIRFAEIGLRFAQVDVSGMARGTLIDRRAAQSFGLASMRLSSASGVGAMLTGAFYNSPAMQVAGSAAGVVAVSSPIGSGTCDRAQWTIRKPEPCEAALSCP